ncbi:putative phosphoric monoester hydrolase [Helianthus annuus]|nr:putative phosphoric monoester hydrolase [Helianthus annuus]KAJ0589653.1 putative phosphoric monoester hydrolase [Helianthus annuus]KAJ0758250.1 putative phosphoric monoester hydrolase [Helianthus annuus]KAJ0761910.1 putative phosphoric monoester hydrolase [Helianthus annuus]KAJ0932017.1 putative phosphoric monoester hydrolase [Helianthus annuus]
MTSCRSMLLWKVPTFLLLWTQRVMFTSNYLALLVGLFKILKVGTFLLPSKLISFFLLVLYHSPKDVYRLKQLNVGGIVTLKEPYETLVPTSSYQAHDIDHPVIPTRDIAHPVIPTRDYLSEVLFLLCDLSLKLCLSFLTLYIYILCLFTENATRCRTTYMHCKAGKERSTTIMLCYLVEYRYMTPIAALEYVRSRRPRVLLAPSQWKVKAPYVP